MKCPDCKADFPSDLITDMCVNGSYRRVCPLCGLEIMRDLHGLPDYEFTAPIAKDMYERAVNHIKVTGQIR
jgi:hypothetical protein